MALRVFLNEIYEVSFAPVGFKVRQQVHVHMFKSKYYEHDIDSQNLLDFWVDL